MTWEWSHTHEAYAAVHDNIMALPRAEQEVIMAEWKAAGRGGHFYPKGLSGAPFDRRRYARALATLQLEPDYFFQDTGDGSIVGDRIWTLTERQALCTNGGGEAWVCPYGCHTVPFHTPYEEQEDDEDECSHEH
jgi:hypothetical protein